MKNRITAAVLCTSLLAVPTIANAALVTYSFTGDVIFANGIFAGEGSVVSGLFSFDDALAASASGTTLNVFRSDFPTANAAIPNSFVASLSLGSVNVSATSDPSRPPSQVQLQDGTNDLLLLQLGGTVNLQDSMSLRLNDFAADDPTPDGIAAGSGNLTGQLSDSIAIMNLIDPTAFDSAAISDWRTANGDLVRFNLTSLSNVSAIPVPAALPLFASALLGLFGLRRRVNGRTGVVLRQGSSTC